MTAVDVSAFVTPETVEVVGLLGGTLGSDWTLVGGMMVGVHLAASDRQPPRLTKDADLVVDARAVVDPPLLERAASSLLERGFEPQPQANERGETVCHRFVAADVRVDLLAPEGLRAGARSLTTVPGTRTIQVPGGAQALRRSSFIDIQADRTSARVRVPSLLGALVVKACSLHVSDHLEDQERDIAALLRLVVDPSAMRAEIDSQKAGPRRKDLRRLRACQALADANHRGWRGIAASERDLGRAALQTLLGP